MNREIDRGAVSCVGGYDGSFVHVLWIRAFIRQRADVALEERKLSWNNSIHAIHLVQGFWTSVPAQFVVVDGSSL